MSIYGNISDTFWQNSIIIWKTERKLMARRNKSTEFLKECIADSLLKLMEEKTLSQITALEITNTAGVGRATFFRHFSSKEDVLTFKLLLLWERWAQEHELIDISKFSFNSFKT